MQNQDEIVAHLNTLRHNAHFTEAFGIKLRGRHVRRLRDGEWICDEIIDFYFGLLSVRSERGMAAGAAALPRLHVFSTQFYTLLAQTGGGAYDYERVRRWTRRLAVSILSFDLVLVPIHIDLVHWALAVMDCRAKCISFWDSLRGHDANCLQVHVRVACSRRRRGRPSCLGARGAVSCFLCIWFTNHPINPSHAPSRALLIAQNLLRYLTDEVRDKTASVPFDATEWRCEVVADAPQQLNSWDCGVFTCMFAHYLSAGRTPAFTQDDMPRFRRRMLLDICNLRVD